MATIGVARHGRGRNSGSSPRRPVAFTRPGQPLVVMFLWFWRIHLNTLAVFLYDDGLHTLGSVFLFLRLQVGRCDRTTPGLALRRFTITIIVIPLGAGLSRLSLTLILVICIVLVIPVATADFRTIISTPPASLPIVVILKRWSKHWRRLRWFNQPRGVFLDARNSVPGIRIIQGIGQSV